MKRRDEKRIEALLDGAAREGDERWVGADAERAAYLSRTRALGRVISEAWTEGPPAPSPEYVISALRPEMARIDAERAARRPLRRVSERASQWLRPLPIAALAGAAGLALVVLTSLNPPPDSSSAIRLGAAESLAAAPVARSADFDSPTTIYDLAQGNSPVMIFEADDGATVLWMLEDEGLSGLGVAPGWA